MWKPLAHSIDWLLSMTLSRFVRPRGELPRPNVVPRDPAEVTWPDAVEPRFEPAKSPAGKSPGGPAPIDEKCWEFSFASPVDSPWEECRTARGLALGPPDAKRAVILLHGAYEDKYVHPVWMARAFTQQGYRVLIPAGPCHLERAPQGVFSGSPMFWSTDLFVAALYQWLAEVRGLIGFLRREGATQVGVFGNSLGSLVAGLAATLWSDVDFAALLSPVGSHADAIRHSRVAARIWPWMRDLSADQTALLDRWAPCRRRPLTDRLGFFITAYDNLQPTWLQEEWWQAWGQPPRWDYPHAHLSAHYSKDFYRDLAKFAADTAARTDHLAKPEAT